MVFMAGKNKGSAEVLRDYRMLERISRELKEHERRLHDVVARRVARKARTDLEEGLLENLDIVASHMRRAQKEIDKAKRKLKVI